MRNERLSREGSDVLLDLPKVKLFLSELDFFDHHNNANKVVLG